MPQMKLVFSLGLGPEAGWALSLGEYDTQLRLIE